MNQACPVILRSQKGATEILVCKHPKAGHQLIKGSIRPWENLPLACERELLAESGLRALAKTYIGVWEAEHAGEIWGFYLMDSNMGLPEEWKHPCKDKTKPCFHFSWQNLHENLGVDWEPSYKGALGYLQDRCNSYLSQKQE